MCFAPRPDLYVVAGLEIVESDRPEPPLSIPVTPQRKTACYVELDEDTTQPARITRRISIHPAWAPAIRAASNQTAIALGQRYEQDAMPSCDALSAAERHS